jgi:cytochrome c-type biogenesis protein CcmF
MLLFLMGIGPLLPWRAASLSAVLRRLQGPAWAAAIAAAMLALGGAGTAAVVVFGLASFVAAATLAEMARGVRAQRRALGGSWRSATRGAIARNHRLYGGLVVHLGLIVAVVGVSWVSLSDRSSELAIGLGERVSVEGYELRLDGISSREEPHRRVVVADVTVFDAESVEEVVRLHPSLNLYPGSSEPIGTPSIRVGTPLNGLSDLYLSLVSVDSQRAALRFFVNPGVGLLWLGGAVMALGGVVAAWPTRSRPARVPAPVEVEDRREEVPV